MSFESIKISCARAVLMAVFAVTVILSGCGGVRGSSASNAEPDPVAYQITGVDLVPDQIAGQADIGIVPSDPSNPRNSSVVILELELFDSCNTPTRNQYTIATNAGIGVGTRHYKISGQPTNVTIDESTGLVQFSPGADCVPGNYIFDHTVDAVSNLKVAPSNTLKVRFAITE